MFPDERLSVLCHGPYSPEPQAVSLMELKEENAALKPPDRKSPDRKKDEISYNSCRGSPASASLLRGMESRKQKTNE